MIRTLTAVTAAAAIAAAIASTGGTLDAGKAWDAPGTTATTLATTTWVHPVDRKI